MYSLDIYKIQERVGQHMVGMGDVECFVNVYKYYKSRMFPYSFYMVQFKFSQAEYFLPKFLNALKSLHFVEYNKH